MMDHKVIQFREATSADLSPMEQARQGDHEAGPADPRMGKYLAGQHHPQKALASRVIYVAEASGTVIGYIGGHLSRRFDCQGEVQYLYVSRDYRRCGVASELFRMLAQWFVQQKATRVCVDVIPENRAARAFYARHGASELSEYWMVWTDMSKVG